MFLTDRVISDLALTDRIISDLAVGDWVISDLALNCQETDHNFDHDLDRRSYQNVNLREWTVLEEESLSDHPYVCWEFKSRKRDAPRSKSTGWAVKKFDRNAFSECISGKSELDKTRTTDELTRLYTTEISRACDASMPKRRHHKNQRPAFWWNSEISELRNSCKKQRRKAQRAWKSKHPGQEEEVDKYRDARKLLRNAI